MQRLRGTKTTRIRVWLLSVYYSTFTLLIRILYTGLTATLTVPNCKLQTVTNWLKSKWRLTPGQTFLALHCDIGNVTLDPSSASQIWPKVACRISMQGNICANYILQCKITTHWAEYARHNSKHIMFGY